MEINEQEVLAAIGDIGNHSTRYHLLPNTRHCNTRKMIVSFHSKNTTRGNYGTRRGMLRRA